MADRDTKPDNGVTRELATEKLRPVDLAVSKPNACDCDRTRYMRDGKFLCQLRECKCGAVSVEGNAPACAWCEKCDTSIAIGPDDHRPRIPHEFTLRGDDGMHCAYCGALEGKV